jgi:GTP-binding protein
VKIKSAKFVRGITGEDSILHNNYPHIAFVGRSNVGKSSVINAVLNIGELARTGKKQGKTVEVNFFEVNGKYYVVDLPGYGFAQGGQDKRETIRAMILEYLTHKAVAPHTVALILDAKAGLTDFDTDMLHILENEGHRAVLVLNKIDKLNQKELTQTIKDIQRQFPDAELFPYSALTKKNTSELVDLLFK